MMKRRVLTLVCALSVFVNVCHAAPNPTPLQFTQNISPEKAIWIGRMMKEDLDPATEFSPSPPIIEYAEYDLNKDHINERIIRIHSSYYGRTGAMTTVFMNQHGNWVPILNQIAMGIYVMPERTMGTANILLPGPGFKHPVYTWNGKQYAYFGTLDDQTNRISAR